MICGLGILFCGASIGSDPEGRAGTYGGINPGSLLEHMVQ